MDVQRGTWNIKDEYLSAAAQSNAKSLQGGVEGNNTPHIFFSVPRLCGSRQVVAHCCADRTNYAYTCTVSLFGGSKVEHRPSYIDTCQSEQNKTEQSKTKPPKKKTHKPNKTKTNQANKTANKATKASKED